MYRAGCPATCPPPLSSAPPTWWILLKRFQSWSVSWPARSLALTRSSPSAEPTVGPSCSGCGVCKWESTQGVFKRSREKVPRWRKEFQTDSAPMIRRVLGSTRVLQGMEGLLKDGASQGGIFLTAPQCWDSLLVGLLSPGEPLMRAGLPSP